MTQGLDKRGDVNAGRRLIRARPAIAALVVAGALVSAWLFFQPLSSNDSPDALAWNGAEFTLESGDGQRSGGAYRLAGRNRTGDAWLLVSPPIERPAADHSYLSYRIEGLDHGGQVALLWPWTPREPGQNRVLLPWSGDGEHLFRLDTDPEWRGEINRFALFISAPDAGPVTVHEVALAPATPGNRIAAAWTQWTALESWSQRSINFASDARTQPGLHRPPAVAFLIALVALGYFAVRRRRGHGPPWRGIAAIFLLGWLALDLFWQRELLYRLEDTQQRYAGKSAVERNLAAPDGGLYLFIRQAKARLPEPPAVVHLASDIASDMDRYIHHRSQYHLRPHNVSTGTPGPEHIRPGDYVLLLGTHPDLRYDDEDQALLLRGQSRIPATRLFDAPHGVLYAIDE